MNSRNFLLSSFCTVFSIVLSFSILPCGTAACGSELLGEHVINAPLPASQKGASPGVFSATTKDPIFLLNGSVTESAVDLTIPTPVGNWQHKRTYDSGLNTRYAGSELLGTEGLGWLGGNQANMLTKNSGSNDISLMQSASSKRTFVENNGVYEAPSDFSATLEKAGTDADEEFVLTYKDTNEIYVYYGFNVAIPGSTRGKLKERTNIYYRSQNLSGELYEYDNRGFVATVTTAEPQLYCIAYTYDTTGITEGRLTKIELFTGLPDTENTVKIAEAEYAYHESFMSTHDDVGLPGDLVQVKVSTLCSDKISWQTRVTQYRYHQSTIQADNSRTDGQDHQIKAVFEPGAIERIVENNNDISSPEDILAKSDTASLSTGHSVFSYASRAFTYYTENLNTNNSITTSWGTENLSSKYGGNDMDELKPLTDGNGDTIPGYFIPRVKSETINAACSSCTGGSNGGMKKTYTYMSLNVSPANYTNGNPNAVAYLIIEDTTDSEGTPVQRTIYGLDYRGLDLRRIDMENPTSGTINAACHSFIRDVAGKINELRYPTVHALINSDTLVSKFLNPYNSSSDNWSNDQATLLSSVGQIVVYEYDTVHQKHSGTKVKIGSTGDAHYLTAMDYDGNGNIIAEYLFPTRTTSRNANDRIVTAHAYTYWNSNAKLIKTKTTTKQAVPTSQNGSGAVTVEQIYYDEIGKQRWKKDAEGVVAYVGYHPLSGQKTLVINDVDTTQLPAEVASQSSHIGAWAGSVPFARDAGLPTALNRTSKYEIDELGRMTASTNPNGIINRFVFEDGRVLIFPTWDYTTSRSLLPIVAISFNHSNKATIKCEFPPTAAVLANSMPVSIVSGSTPTGLTGYNYDNRTGQLKSMDRYHSIPTGGGAGILGTNYYRTSVIHDTLGRQIASVQYVKDGQWQVEAKRMDWRGWITEGMGGVVSSPPESYSDIVNAPYLKTIFKRFYTGEVLTKQVQFHSSDQSNYSGANYYYDSMYRLRGTAFFTANGAVETSFGPYHVNDYNWQGRVVSQATFEAEPNWGGLVGNAVYALETVNSRKTLLKGYYDGYGRLYRKEAYQIQNGGSTGACVQMDFYYDRKGRVVASQQSDGTATEFAYNTAGNMYQRRVVKSLASTKFTSGKFQYRSPEPSSTLSNMTGGNDGIAALVHFDYDDNGRIVSRHSIDLKSQENTGVSMSTENYVRRTVHYWYDNAGRPVVQADCGSGAAIWAYAAIPARSNQAPSQSSTAMLVQKVSYNSITALPETTTNAKGIVTKIFYDAMKRPISSTLNVVAGGMGNDQNIETQVAYNGVNSVVTQIVVNPTTGNQVTRYLYEDSFNASLLTAAIYPDSSDTTSSGSDQVKRTYHLDGLLNTIRDQNGTVRTMLYDSRRRLVGDQVTTLGTDVDGAARKITRSYNVDGLLEKVTTLDSGNVPINEVMFEFDAHNRLTRKYDEFAGAVAANSSLYLQYRYDDTASGGVLIHGGRPIGVNYPAGKRVDYSYGESNSFDDLMNRPASVQVNEQSVVQYELSGMGAPMQTRLTEPSLTSTLQDGGLDRFGRVINYSWLDENADPLVHIIHSYDFNGNRLSRYDAVNAASSEMYAYDDVDQIINLQRGVLNENQTEMSTSTFSEAWDFDKTGNWTQYNRNGIVENRTYNAANEIQNIATHDANGNMTLMPGLKGKYDAWNRLVEVRDTSDHLLAKYEYNGLNHRIVKKSYAENTLVETRYYFYNATWQCLEERVGNNVDRTYVWGMRSVDDMICRERGDERLYPLTDPNGNVVAIVDGSGEVKERYRYDAFGKVTVLSADFTEKAASEFDWDYLYTSRQRDRESGLMYYRNRYYHPALGRFVSRDPLEYDAGDVNLYRYVANRPIIGTDPSGLVQPGSCNQPGVFTPSLNSPGASPPSQLSLTCMFQPLQGYFGNETPPPSINHLDPCLPLSTNSMTPILDFIHGTHTPDNSTTFDSSQNATDFDKPKSISAIAPPKDSIEFNDEHGLVGAEITLVIDNDPLNITATGPGMGTIYQTLNVEVSGNPEITLHPQKYLNWLPPIVRPPSTIVDKAPSIVNVPASYGGKVEFGTAWQSNGGNISAGASGGFGFNSGGKGTKPGQNSLSTEFEIKFELRR